MFLEGLDELDQKNCAAADSKCAHVIFRAWGKTGISRVAVKMRVQALEQRGVIEQYTAIVNPQKLSGAVSCYFELETAPGMLAGVAEALCANDTITQVYRVTGNNKLHVHAVAASAEEMEALIRDVIDPLPGVTACCCNTILSRMKDVKGLRL